MNFMASVVPGETNRADFVLIPLANGLIKGTITDSATGEVVARAVAKWNVKPYSPAASEGDGTYKMVGVPPRHIQDSDYDITEYADASVENVEVQRLTPTTIGRLQLNKRPMTGAIADRILDNTTGNPVSGATIDQSVEQRSRLDPGSMGITALIMFLPD